MKTIEAVSIPVVNQEKSKEFYLKLGFQVIVEAPLGNGQSWVQLGIPNQATTIALVSWWPMEEMAAGSLKGLMLETDDIEREVQQLKAKGIEVSEISDSPYGRFAFLKDIDGNGLSIHQK